MLGNISIFDPEKHSRLHILSYMYILVSPFFSGSSIPSNMQKSQMGDEITIESHIKGMVWMTIPGNHRPLGETIMILEKPKMCGEWIVLNHS
jgi:hypothetical protein